MKLLLAFFFLLSFTEGQSQKKADTLVINGGKLIIQPVLHGSIVLSWNEKTVYIDPYGGAEKYSGLKKPDIILITDIHGDHLNVETLEGLNTRRARFFVPEAVKEKMASAESFKESTMVVISNGQTIILDDMEILAVPMYNLPETEDSRHPKGRGNGYILTLGGKRVYISGDTEDTPEMRNLRNIDVAFICMNLPYTMDVDQAASAVLDFIPRIVYPYHYRGKNGLSDIEDFKRKVDKGQSNIEVRLRDWY